MKSPFPGMDPYLEPHWLDVHTTLVGEARRLEPHAAGRPGGAGRGARGRRVGEERFTALSGRTCGCSPRSTADPDEGEGGVAIEAPFKLVVEHEPVIERFIRVLDESGRLVTVIEFLSPTNKRHPRPGRVPPEAGRASSRGSASGGSRPGPARELAGADAPAPLPRPGGFDVPRDGADVRP